MTAESTELHIKSESGTELCTLTFNAEEWGEIVQVAVSRLLNDAIKAYLNDAARAYQPDIGGKDALGD